jgi:hypothetical protein
MLRAVSFLVVLAHLSVASIPCVGAGTAEKTPIPVGASQIHHPPAAQPLQPVAKNAHPDHHDSDTPNSPAQHAAAGGDRNHADHTDHAAAREDLRAQIATDAESVLAELHAPCPCGCSKSTNSPGTTSSPRLGFVLFPPRPIPLPEATPSFIVAEVDPMPAAPEAPLDHIPIS